MALIETLMNSDFNAEPTKCVQEQHQTSQLPPPPPKSTSMGKGRIMYTKEIVTGSASTGADDSFSTNEMFSQTMDTVISNNNNNDDDDDDSSSSSSSSSDSDSSDSDESSDEDDDDHEKAFSTSTMSLDESVYSALTCEDRVRIQPIRTIEFKTISAVMLRTDIDALKKEPAKFEMPAGKWLAPEFNFKYPTASKNAKIIRMREVLFDDTPSDSDTVMVYSRSLKLMSLREFIDSRSNFKNTFIQDQMIETAYGTALRKLSTNYPIETCQYKRTIANNAKLTPNIYTLVYGAVPDLMGFEYASYILLKKYKYKTSERKTAPYLAEGDLEIGAYCYTMLASLDLVKWRNDVNRSTLKALLKYACCLIPDKALRLRILAIINIKDEKYLTAEAMLLLKREFSTIVSALRKIQDTDASTHAINIWNCFMKKANLHHYLCPHTLNEVSKGIKVIGKKLIVKLEELELQNQEYDMTTIKYTLDETKQYFNFMPHLHTATGESMKRVQKSLSSLYNHIVKMFGDHLIDFGIYPSTTRINVDHVEGFKRLHAKLLSSNNNEVYIPVMESKFASVTTAITLRVQQRRPELDLDKVIKLDREALISLMMTINLIILKRVEILMYMDDHDQCIGRAIHAELQNLFESNEFTSIDNMEAWTRLDDEEVSKDELIDDGDDDDDDDDEDYNENEVVDNDANLRYESEQLVVDSKRKYVAPEPIPKKAPRPSKKVTSANLVKVTPRNYKRVCDETPYKMNTENIPRTQCVMCKRRRTLKAVTLRPDIEIACCVNCYRRLVIDYLSPDKTVDFETIIHRIENQYAIPIAFDINDKYITDEEFNIKKSRVVYNRILKATMPPKKPVKRSAKNISTAKNDDDGDADNDETKEPKAKRQRSAAVDDLGNTDL